MTPQPDPSNMDETRPPPYEKSPKENVSEASEYDDCCEKIVVPPWALKKIARVESHEKRFRLALEYVARKGNIVEERDAALKRQERALKERLKSIKDDIEKIRRAHIDSLWYISKTKKNRLRTFVKMTFRDVDFINDMERSLIEVGNKEALREHKIETEKIHAASRKALEKLIEEFKILPDAKRHIANQAIGDDNGDRGSSTDATGNEAQDLG
ncbi:hypothetical protein Trco_006489 [Trichoderma cornu-damae]|uniref:Uncharacterized protein n=1 Tax=Trichoderma cornu-damae TaxID=654480 RepID=A0A9P8QLX5_9HYPO|nr:hypothetical protein Trco_006489 [Trichoderma cornu-damae]